MKKFLIGIIIIAIIAMIFTDILAKGMLLTAVDLDFIYVKDTNDTSYEVKENVDDPWHFKLALLSGKWVKNNEDCDCSSIEFLEVNKSLWALLDLEENMVELDTSLGKYYITLKHVEELFPKEMWRR